MENLQDIDKDKDSEEESFLDNIDFDKIIEILIKSIPWVIIINILMIFGAYTYLRYTKDIFRSSSLLKLEKKGEAGFNFFSLNQETDNSELLGEIEFIKSDIIYNALVEAMPELQVGYYAEGSILDRELYNEEPFEVINYQIKNQSFYNKRIDINIKNSKSFELSYQNGDDVISKTYKFGQEIVTRNFKLRVKQKKSSLNYEHFYFIIYDKNYLVNYFRERLTANIVNLKAKTLGISFEGHNSKKIQHIVNVADTIYMQESLEHKSLEKKKKNEYIDEQLKKTEDSLNFYEQQLEEFIIENKTSNTDEKMSAIVGEIEKLLKEKNTFIEQLGLLREIEDNINEDSTINQYLPALIILENESLTTKIVQVNEIIHKINKAKQKVKNKKLMSSQYLDLEKQKEGLFKNIDAHKKVLYRQVSKVREKIIDAETKITGLPSKGTRYRRLERQKQIYEQFYLNNLNKRIELGIAEAGTVPESIILSPATNPSKPIAPNRFQIYLVAVGLGVFLSALVIVLRYLAHNTITNIKELERVIKVSILGGIPEYNKRKMKYTKLVVGENPKSMINESLRAIRTNLEFMLPEGKKLFQSNEKGVILSVTSTVSGEGKTFVATNLAGIIASSGLKVIVIDCDMRKPKLHIAFDAENVDGVSNILIGKKGIKDCVKKSELENLHFISAGAIPPNPAELILRNDFNQLLDNLKKEFQVIVIDCPPVGLVTDGALIMKRVDLPLYVARANYSKKAFGKNINKLARNNKFSNLAVILNAVKRRSKSYGYGSYGGYGNYGGYYGGYYEDKPERKGFFTRFKRK